MLNSVFHTVLSLDWLMPSVPSANITGLWHNRRMSSADNVYFFSPCCSIQVDLPQPGAPRSNNKILILLFLYFLYLTLGFQKLGDEMLHLLKLLP